MNPIDGGGFYGVFYAIGMLLKCIVIVAVLFFPTDIVKALLGFIFGNRARRRGYC
jgi:hypothetical protein